jgi:RNA polymerase II-associated protein 1
MGQAFTILLRLGPGDGDFASAIMNRLTPEWAAAREIILSSIFLGRQSDVHSPSRSALGKVRLSLNRDWSSTPLDHLLRSGDSADFKALPTSWNASEVEITRPSLFVTKIIQEALFNRFHLEQRGGGVWMHEGIYAGAWSISERFC